MYKIIVYTVKSNITIEYKKSNEKGINNVNSSISYQIWSAIVISEPMRYCITLSKAIVTEFTYHTEQMMDAETMGRVDEWI